MYMVFKIKKCSYSLQFVKRRGIVDLTIRMLRLLLHKDAKIFENLNPVIMAFVRMLSPSTLR